METTDAMRRFAADHGFVNDERHGDGIVCRIRKGGLAWSMPDGGDWADFWVPFWQTLGAERHEDVTVERLATRAGPLLREVATADGLRRAIREHPLLLRKAIDVASRRPFPALPEFPITTGPELTAIFRRVLRKVTGERKGTKMIRRHPGVVHTIQLDTAPMAGSRRLLVTTTLEDDPKAWLIRYDESLLGDEWAWVELAREPGPGPSAAEREEGLARLLPPAIDRWTFAVSSPAIVRDYIARGRRFDSGSG